MFFEETQPHHQQIHYSIDQTSLLGWKKTEQEKIVVTSLSYQPRSEEDEFCWVMIWIGRCSCIWKRWEKEEESYQHGLQWLLLGGLSWPVTDPCWWSSEGMLSSTDTGHTHCCIGWTLSRERQPQQRASMPSQTLTVWRENFGRCGSHCGNGRNPPRIDPKLGSDRYQNGPK